MGMVIDVGAQSRNDVIAPVRVLLDELRKKSEREELSLRLLTDARVVGGHFAEFIGSEEELLRQFEATDILGFIIGVAKYCFVSVHPPKCFDSKLEVWRIIAEMREQWDEKLLDKLISFPAIDYVVITQDDTLDLDDLHRVNKANFPWEDWQLVAARLSS
jgi:hypothetical protein